MKPITTSLLLSCMLVGCASFPPSAKKLAALPIVTYPDKPASADYIYKLPAGKPIDLSLIIDGSALNQNIRQSLSTSLVHDIYLHKYWASEDARHWVNARELISINFNMVLPSYETPNPGEIHLTVNHKLSK